MEIQLNHVTNGSPSSSSTTTTTDRNPNPNPTSDPNPMQSWWESVSKARSRIHALSSILPSTTTTSSSISSLADSERPARSLLESHDAYLTLSTSLSNPRSGSGDDPLCQWLYETFQSSDLDLRLIVLSFIPLLSGIYLSRIISNSNSTPSLAGFEAVMLALYASETKTRAGKPVLISLPDLSQPSLYHYPRNKQVANSHSHAGPAVQSRVLCPPLEPQNAVKSTKRAFIIGIALDCYFKQISQMPSWSKLDLCQFAAAWAGQNCSCRNEFDTNTDGESNANANGDENGNTCEIRDFSDEIEIEEVIEKTKKLGFGENSMENGDSRGVRIPLPWELLQPVLRILGHCLLAPLNTQDVRDAASFSVRCIYARASHELMPQALLATRSLIQLDNRVHAAAKVAAAANSASNANTLTKSRKPEILLSSK